VSIKCPVANIVLLLFNVLL